MASGGILEALLISAGSVVGGVRVLKAGAVAYPLASGLGLDYWQAELVPGVWLQGQGSQSLLQIVEGEAKS